MSEAIDEETQLANEIYRMTSRVVEFFGGRCGLDDVTRATAVVNIVSSTPDPDNPNRTIADAGKLTERRLDVVLAEIDRRFPEFWLPVDDSFKRGETRGFINQVIVLKKAGAI